MNPSAETFVIDQRSVVGSVIVRRMQAGGSNNLLARTHAEFNLLDQRAVHAFVSLIV